MSVYNDETRVKKAIESILNQSYENFEFLIVDDCSTDETFTVCNEYQKKDSRIRLYRNKENIGLTKSLNFLINQSEFELLARQDSDDISHKHRLEKQVNFMKAKNLDATTTVAIIDKLKKRRPFISQFVPRVVRVSHFAADIAGSMPINEAMLVRSIGGILFFGLAMLCLGLWHFERKDF